MRRRRWSDLSGGQRTAVLVLGTVQLAAVAAAWSDLASRRASEVHGSKGLWAVAIAVNGVGPPAYFRWGRSGRSRRRR